MSHHPGAKDRREAAIQAVHEATSAPLETLVRERDEIRDRTFADLYKKKKTPVLKFNIGEYLGDFALLRHHKGK